MTKSKAEEMAVDYANNLSNLIWNFRPEEALSNTFRAGAAWLLQKAESYCGSIPLEFASPRVGKQNVTTGELADANQLKNYLKKLVEEKV